MKIPDEKIEVVPIDQIDDNPFQTRQHYPRKEIDELAVSIDEHNLRQIPEARRKNGRVQLAYGHLRHRAIAKLCKKKPKKWLGMPLRIKDLTDEEMFYYALEENMRRHDVTPIDVASSIERFLTAFPKITEVEVAQKLNMTQGNISNMRRVLRLPRKVLDSIEEGRINFTMGRELLVFQGKKGVSGERYSTEESRYVPVPTDDEALMMMVIRSIAKPDSADTRYGVYPRTVDGIKKAIYSVAHGHFRRLWIEGTVYDREGDPLFDVSAEGCLKCEHMIRAHETKSQRRPFCTNIECWAQKQKAHKDRRAKETKKQMEEDIRRRALEMQNENISQEISGGEREKKHPEMSEPYCYMDDCQLCKSAHPECVFCCAECPPQDHCNGRQACRMPAVKDSETETRPVEPKKPLKVPKAMLKQAEKAAGTRAEILDMEDIREGHWGLKHGYIRLDEVFNQMDDPDQCRERCTQGFHFAFDSRHGDRDRTLMICSDPHCVGQKKAAFTRKKNAAGQALKKAEGKAINQAIAQTVTLDVPRMVLIIQAQLEGYHTESWHSINEFNAKRWWWDRFMDKDMPGGQPLHELYERLKALDEEDLTKTVVQFMFEALLYRGDLGRYKAKTTEALNRMGVGINLNQPKKEEEPK